MSDFCRWLAVGLIAAIFPSFVCAAGCFNDSSIIPQKTPLAWNIGSADMLEWFTRNNCTIIYGDINILPSYNGAFVIPNVEEIQGTISINGSMEKSQINLTSIELPDVKRLSGIKLPEIPALQAISMANAEEILIIQLTQQSSVIPHVDFQSLRFSIWLYLEGAYSNLEFNSLEEVSGALSLCSAINCGWTDKVDLNISLPALRSAGYLELSGAINSLSLPVLEVANYTGQSTYSRRSGLYLENYGRPLALDFPKLRSVGKRLYLRGSISSLSLGSLVTMEHELSINTNSSLDLNFTTLENAYSINLSGSINSVEFPALKKADLVTIQTTTELDCHPAQEALQRANTSSLSTCNGQYVWANLDPSPESKPKESSSHSMSTGAKVGLAVGCVIGGLALIAVSVWAWLKMKRRKASETLPCGTPSLSQERIKNSLDEAPPPYSANPSA